ncbi:MAG: hypothetical protein A2W01_06295 [Candidatus Solincola sediminis]|nr:MAG: hypothetical protein A2W01_06295 [Candidatus Solincola sediminis]
MAKEKLSELWDSQSGVLSTQVLQEFYVIVTRKIPKPLSNSKSRDIIESLLGWEVINNDVSSILRSIDLQDRYRYSFWDCLIIDAALKSEADILLSEDLKHGQAIGGLRILNPFMY